MLFPNERNPALPREAHAVTVDLLADHGDVVLELHQLRQELGKRFGWRLLGRRFGDDVELA
jgi:hypothetical protein